MFKFNSVKVFMFICIVLYLGCTKKPEPITSQFKIISEIKGNSNSPFYINFSEYPKDRRSLPIGVFDSGTGGLTVLNSLMVMDSYNNQTQKPGADRITDFDQESFIYLGDKANMPYGKYDSEGKADFLRELIIKDVQFLLGQRYYNSPEDPQYKKDKKQVKAVVIACNTATAFGLDLIKKSLKNWNVDIGVLGIIEAGSKAAVHKLPQNQKGYSIGVFATEGTCATQGYPMSIKKAFSTVFENDDIAIVQQAGYGLAAAIDGDINYIDPNSKEIRGKELYYGPGLNHPRYPIGLDLWREYNFSKGNELLQKKDSNEKIVDMELNSVENYIRYHVTQMVIKLSQQLKDRKLNAIILGCTHYPFFTEEILDHFMYLRNLDKKYARIIPEKLLVIDPAHALAIELYEYLLAHKLLNTKKQCAHQFYISVPNIDLAENVINKEGEFPFSYKYGRNINSGLMFVKRLPFSQKWIKKDILERIQKKMPHIYSMAFGSESATENPVN
jgi:glutamate racemase